MMLLRLFGSEVKSIPTLVRNVADVASNGGLVGSCLLGQLYPMSSCKCAIAKVTLASRHWINCPRYGDIFLREAHGPDANVLRDM